VRPSHFIMPTQSYKHKRQAEEAREAKEANQDKRFAVMEDHTRAAVLAMYDVLDSQHPGHVIPGYDRDHAERTTRVVLTVARALGMSETRLADLELIALLHDLGRAGMDPKLFGAIFGLAQERGLPVRIRELLTRYPEVAEEQAPAYFLDLISPALHEQGLETTEQLRDHIAMRMNFKGRLRGLLKEREPELRALGLELKPFMETVMLYYYYPEGMETADEDVRLMGMILVACENFEAFNNWRRGRDYYGRAKERLSDVFEALAKFEADGLVSSVVMATLRRLTTSGDLDAIIKESRGVSPGSPLPDEDLAFQRSGR